MGGKKHEEHENHERWIIPYADMVTLLFAFFVVMYSISQQDLAKLKNVSESISEAFMGHKKGGDPAKLIQINTMKNKPPETSPRVVVRRTMTSHEIIAELKKILDQEGFDFIHQQELSPIKIKVTERGVMISMSAGYLFEENSTEVDPRMFPVLNIISDIIKSTNRLVSVEGHTDNLPVVGNVFYSNWELSALRATSTARVLIDQFFVDPTKIVAAGYAHYRPVADNATDAGRAQNRRVDIVLLNAKSFEDLESEGAVGNEAQVQIHEDSEPQ